MKTKRLQIDKHIIQSIRYIIAYAWRICKSLFVVTALRGLFSALSPLINIAGPGMVLNALVSRKTMSKVIDIILIYISVNLCIGVISHILNLLESNISRKVSNIMQFEYMNDCMNINYHYVQDRSILDLKLKSMSAHPSVFLDKIGDFIKYTIQFAGIMYVIFILSPWFVFALLFTSAISILLAFKTRKNDFEFKNTLVEEDRKIDYLYNVMTGYPFAKEIRINRANSFIENKYNNTLKIQMKKFWVHYKNSLRISTLSTVITILQTCIMYIYFSYQVYSRQINIAEYTVLLGAVTLLASLLSGFFDNIAIIGRVCKSFDIFRDYKSYIAKNSNISASDSLPDADIDFANAVIRFENVSFTYPNTGRAILKNMNFTIHKGEKIGIVGLNGSGKTTLVKLLTRVYDPTEGKITINGRDIRDIPHRQYISHIGIVLQDFMLFAYSIKDNIVFNKGYDEGRLMESIKKSGLEQKIDSLNKRIDTVIYKELDSEGIEFSGGEGQKLALARAIYKNAGLLILDEPTSTLDPLAEYELFTKLADIAGDKTAIFISHRLSSTRFCDRVIVLKEGRITECGNHDELIVNNGFYAVLFNAQARYYRESGVLSG